MNNCLKYFKLLKYYYYCIYKCFIIKNKHSINKILITEKKIPFLLFILLILETYLYVLINIHITIFLYQYIFYFIK